MTTGLPPSARSQGLACLKWALMTAALFWVVVFKLSQAKIQLPDFVYVNF